MKPRVVTVVVVVTMLNEERGAMIVMMIEQIERSCCESWLALESKQVASLIIEWQLPVRRHFMDKQY